MQFIFVLLIVIGAALIISGIFRIAADKEKLRKRDEESRVEVVYRVPSVFDRRDKKQR